MAGLGYTVVVLHRSDFVVARCFGRFHPQRTVLYPYRGLRLNCTIENSVWLILDPITMTVVVFHQFRVRGIDCYTNVRITFTRE